jgi:hypothetical protein
VGLFGNSFDRRLRDISNRDLCILLALVLALIYANNVFHFSQYRINKVFDRTSEGMIVGRLGRSAAEGIGAKGGTLGTNKAPDKEDSRDYDAQVKYFETPALISTEKADWDSYDSQLGLQGIFYSLLDAVNPLPRSYRIGFYHFLSALTCTAVLMWVGAMIGARFGRPALLGFTVAIGFEPMFTALAPNLYWAVGLWFLPMALAMHLVNAGTPGRRRLLLMAIGGAVFVKALCGYEYITCVILAAATGCLLNTRDDAFYDNVADMMRVCVVGVVGFVLAMLLHGLETGFSTIMARALDRTTVSGASLDQGLILGRFASVASVLRTYFGANDYTQIRNFGVVLGLIGAIALVAFFEQRYSWFLGDDRKKLRSLAVAYLVSFAAPLSWFILAKGHAYVHPFLDFILWYLPTMPIGGAIVGVALGDIFANRRKWAHSIARSLVTLSIPLALVLLLAIVALLDRNVDAKGTWVLEAHARGTSVFADKDIGVDFRLGENWFTVEYVCRRVSPEDIFVIRASESEAAIDYDFRLKDRVVAALDTGKCYYAQPRRPGKLRRIEFGLTSDRRAVWHREAVL